ncbi:MAG: hypothetical protein JWM35_1005, partial [Verrucomicrobia bacterium]|nr:hypothetical protein [Verrucomicrobiota bacterium]
QFKDVLLEQGQLAPAGPPQLIFWTDQIKDRKIFSMMSPEPVKVTVPFGLGAEMIEGRYVFSAQSTSEVEIVAPANSRHISATVGLNPAAYDRSDGIEVVIIYAPAGGGRQELYRRYLRPAVVKADQGPQEISLETTGPMSGSVLFRIQPGGGPNFDWGYWAKIEVH